MSNFKVGDRVVVSGGFLLCPGNHGVITKVINEPGKESVYKVFLDGKCKPLWIVEHYLYSETWIDYLGKRGGVKFNDIYNKHLSIGSGAFYFPVESLKGENEMIEFKNGDSIRVTDEMSKNEYINYTALYNTACKNVMFRSNLCLDSIDHVIFNPPATIIFWVDGSKTVVKCGENDEFDPEKGLAMAIAKKALGNKHDYYDAFWKHLPKEFKKSLKTK